MGDYGLWIGRKNPDFLGTDGRKQVIEMFGLWWHDLSIHPNRPTNYEKYGFTCLILWEDEVWCDVEGVVEKVRTFIGGVTC